MSLERLRKVEYVADLLDVTPSWVYSACEQDRIPFVRVGRYLRFRESEILAWLESQRGGPQ